MSKKKQVILFCAFCLLLLGIAPPAIDPARFTGEEELLGQLRGVGQWVYTAVRPAPQLAPTAEMNHIDLPARGVNTFLEQEVLPEVREESLRLAHDAGFRFIRQQFAWEDIEIHAKDDFIDRRNVAEGVDAWAKYDNIVDLANRYDIEVIARLDNPPAWSRALTDTIGTHAPPDNFDDYGDYVEAVVQRYNGQITYFQLWNEPNIYPEWGEQVVSPERFTDLLCEGYRRAKAVNPDAVILAGALSPTVALNYRDLNDLIFLQRMYRAGAGDCFDILSAQGYGLFSGADDYRLRPTVVNYPHNLLLRDVMVANGDEHKPIWISEMAWNAVPDGLPQSFGQVSEALQATYAIDAYQRLQTDWPWVGVSNYWFLKRATDLEKNQPFYYFRLLEPDFTPLPAYTAFVETAADPAPAPHGSLWHRWNQMRSWLILSGGAILFYMGTAVLLTNETEE